MKKLKWITVTTYVEKETGQILTKKDAELHYVQEKKLLRKTKTRYNEQTHNLEGQRNYSGITERIIVCTRTGKQGTLW